MVETGVGLKRCAAGGDEDAGACELQRRVGRFPCGETEAWEVERVFVALYKTY